MPLCIFKIAGEKFTASRTFLWKTWLRLSEECLEARSCISAPYTSSGFEYVRPRLDGIASGPIGLTKEHQRQAQSILLHTPDKNFKRQTHDASRRQVQVRVSASSTTNCWWTPLLGKAQGRVVRHILSDGHGKLETEPIDRG